MDYKLSPQSTVHSPQQELVGKLVRINAILSDCTRVIVAFSGGVDSTLLASLARDVLGKANVLAVTADSASLAQADLAEARRLAQELDLEHLVIQTAEVDNPDYRANTAARCFFCKQELFVHLQRLAQQRGFSVILYGAIRDDVLEERPGAVAASQAGARAPLQEAGLSKAQVRELARQRGLPNWDRPQNACLSSRVPHGLDVTPEKLARIERAEAALLQLGFRQVRVRHLEAHARIEVGQEEVVRFEDPQLRRRVADALTSLGFASVGVDQAGYRSGGANRQPIEEYIL